MLKFIRVKHLFALICCILLTLLCVDHLEFRLIPLWALHYGPHSTEEHSDNPQDNFTPDLIWDYIPACSEKTLESHSEIYCCDPENSGSLTMSSFRQKTGSVLQSYHLPTLQGLAHVQSNTFKAHKLHKLSLQNAKVLPNEKILQLRSGFFNRTIVHAVLSIWSTALTRQLVLSILDTRFESLWWSELLELTGNTTQEITASTLLLSPYCNRSPGRSCANIFVGFTVLDSNGPQFFTLAFNLANGKLLWRHLSGETHSATQKSADSASISSHWKLQLIAHHQQHLHADQPSWSSQRGNLLDLLPIHWYSTKDTQFRLAFLTSVTQSMSSGSRSKVYASAVANTLVAIHAHGVTLLDLASGKLRAHLQLELEPGCTYAGLSVTGSAGKSQLHRLRLTSKVVRSNSATSGPEELGVPAEPSVSEEDANKGSADEGDFSHTVDCRGILTSLDDDTLAISSATVFHRLCRPHGLFEYSRFGRASWREDETKTVPPLVVPKRTVHGGPIGFLQALFPSSRYWKGTSLLHDYHGRLAEFLFLTSDGSLTSIDENGQEQWRTDSQVSWLQISRNMVAARQNPDTAIVDWHLYNVYTRQFHPSIYPVNLLPLTLDAIWFAYMRAHHATEAPFPTNEVFPSQVSTAAIASLSGLLVVGWDSISVVDHSTGRLLATHRLPAHPVGPPRLLPLLTTNLPDNTTNSAHLLSNSLILLPCDGLLLAFGLAYSLRFSLLFTTTLGLVFSFLTMHWCCGPDNSLLDFVD